MNYKTIIIYVAVAVAVIVIIRLSVALIKAGILQRLWQRIRGTRGFSIFKKIMRVVLVAAVVFVVGYFIYTGYQL